MKKGVFCVFASFLLFSCSFNNNENIILNNIEPKKVFAEVKDIKQIATGDSIDEKELNYHIDYPIFDNLSFSNSIHSFFDVYIRQKKEEFAIQKTNLNKLTPEIHASFREYKGENIKTILYEIFEIGVEGTEKEYIKTFYIDSKGQELQYNDILSINSIDSQNSLKKLLYYKFKGLDYFVFDGVGINKGLEDFLKAPKFYIDGNYIYFLFEDEIIKDISGIFRLRVDILELKPFLNLNIVELPQETKVEKVDVQDEHKDMNMDNYIIFEQIGETKYKNTLSKDKKYVSLTFDDGPSKINTPILLDILEKNDVKVTFFVLGKNANYFPDIIKKIDEKGHEIGSHSWNHPQLTRLSEEDVKKQLYDTDTVIYDAIGKTPKLLRPPYGEYNSTTNKIADRTIVLWNLDTLDWKTRNIESNVKSVEDNVKEGSIILLHDIHKTTVDSVDRIIKAIKNKGFEIVTVSDLLDHYQTGDYFGKVCSSGYTCK